MNNGFDMIDLSDFSEQTRFDTGTTYKGRHGFDTSAHTLVSFFRIYEISLVIVGIEEVPRVSTEFVDSESFSRRCQWKTRMRLDLKIRMGRRPVIPHDPFPNVLAHSSSKEPGIGLS